MSEQNETKDDVVKSEEYNKVVEQHNSVKSENEELKKKLAEIEKQKEETKANQEKESWEKEKQRLQQEKEEMEKKLEEYKTRGTETPGSKGVVKGYYADKQSDVKDPKSLLDERYPGKKFNPNSLNALDRFGHYKNPASTIYDDQKFGELISLQASAISVNPNLVAEQARKGQAQIQFRKN